MPRYLADLGGFKSCSSDQVIFISIIGCSQVP
ncbi:hypothetical protein L286_04355 [Sphingobium sp. HDIP04]|nr:hypothetical protein L286_04355 [Sphingobium sp. HDIP04]